MARTLFELFTESAERHPDQAALEVGSERWTYADLRRAADVIAAGIVDAIGAAPATVALLATRHAHTYAAYLAAGQLGAAVIPLSERHPRDRQAFMCEQAGAPVILCSAADADGAVRVAEALEGVAALEIEGGSVRAATAGGAARRERVGRDVAYVLFTSGTTGRPKGVPVRHANVVPYVAYNVDRYGAQPGDRFSQTFDLTFDPSVFDLFVAWSSGACLVVPTEVELMEPVEFVRERAITHWFSVPSLIAMARRRRRLVPEAMPTLRWSLFAGEQLPIENAEAWHSAAPNSALENLYGPTELTITCTAYRLPAGRGASPATPNGTVPIGPPYPHVEIVLLDEAAHPADEEGELCVRGVQRFPGYLEPAENAGRFVVGGSDSGFRLLAPGEPVADAHWYRTGDRVRRDADGSLVHLGRIDHQIKFRGFRIELGEIEATIRRGPGVADAAVVPREAGGSVVELMAFYSGPEEAAPAIADTLARTLPDYMVPRRLRHVDDWPLNVNGKTDRAALRTLAERQPVGTARA